ncbi:MAG TPA: TetR family transcriptional regulator [Burkholderiales bacterium]|nr:TetR family transcriptional regulator [Burkholderiales bacterium]
MARRPARRRGALATRAAILAAAKLEFSRRSYDQVGVRDIAARAGVNPALVNRYFGSKPGLFAAAYAQDIRLQELLRGERAALGERLARRVMRRRASQRGDSLSLLFRSATSAKALPMIRKALAARFIEPLGDWLGGRDAEQRAALITAYLLGLATLSVVLRNPALGRSSAESVVRRVAPVLQRYVDRD